jgi:hypothetical protein
LISYSDGAWRAETRGTATRWGTPSFSNGVLEIPLSLAWGNKFEGENPNKYFNSREYAADFVTKASVLSSIKTFSVTVNGGWGD